MPRKYRFLCPDCGEEWVGGTGDFGDLKEPLKLRCIACHKKEGFKR